ncbi:MAG: glycosyl hydrolase family 28-related protein, partial [Lentisphaeria bacterium]|nr:glycosyl hydrolase family 28-related protein [Lentisphaeria bacterium]
MRCLPACLVLLASAATAAQVNVRDHGAVGDGVAKDTKAIQQAIDVCAEGGGGRVVLPKGRYLSGSLVLRDGVTLVVEPEAVLLGSRELADFSGPLLGAKDARNIGIEGGGTIDGQGEAYWEKARDYNGPAWKGTAQFEYKALRRPAFIRFTGCSDLTVRNIKLVGAPSWTLHLQR